MKRRQFITLLGGAAVLSPLAVRAQDRARRIGILHVPAEGDPESQARLAVFRDGLRQFGWTVGGNVEIDNRWASGSSERLRANAAELVASKPDVIVAGGTTQLTAVKRETSTIPIVVTQVIDPVGGGFVASLARPGGNITGFAQHEYGLAAKWLELMKQIAPHVIRVALVRDSFSGAAAGLLREMEPAARSLGVQLEPMAVSDTAEAERAVAAFAREPNSGLIVVGSPFTVAHRSVLIRLAARHRLPAVYAFSYMARDGGLASYGIDTRDLWRRSASYVDRILKGEKPGDLPVQQATKFELVINLKTAKALGLDPPMSLLARTDEVIE